MLAAYLWNSLFFAQKNVQPSNNLVVFCFSYFFIYFFVLTFASITFDSPRQFLSLVAKYLICRERYNVRHRNISPIKKVVAIWYWSTDDVKVATNKSPLMVFQQFKLIKCFVSKNVVSGETLAVESWATCTFVFCDTMELSTTHSCVLVEINKINSLY